MTETGGQTAERVRKLPVMIAVDPLRDKLKDLEAAGKINLTPQGFGAIQGHILSAVMELNAPRGVNRVGQVVLEIDFTPIFVSKQGYFRLRFWFNIAARRDIRSANLREILSVRPIDLSRAGFKAVSDWTADPAEYSLSIDLAPASGELTGPGEVVKAAEALVRAVVGTLPFRAAAWG